MIYHVVTGDVAAEPLRNALALDPSMEGEIIVIKDVLSVGPLKRAEGQKFAELRSAFWQDVMVHEKSPVQVDDLDRLLRAGNELSKNEKDVIWLWIAPWPADVCTYHWAVKYLARHGGRLFVVNIAGLPFLDEDGKLFFPKSIGEILPKELVKARKLARLVTPAEIEVDGFEWGKLTDENGGVRTHEGGKRLTSRPINYYDEQLLSCCSMQFQKASKVVGQALTKFNLPTGDFFLGWRLRKMAELGKLDAQGDQQKALRDFEVKLPGQDGQPA